VSLLALFAKLPRFVSLRAVFAKQPPSRMSKIPSPNAKPAQRSKPPSLHLLRAFFHATTRVLATRDLRHLRGGLLRRQRAPPRNDARGRGYFAGRERLLLRNSPEFLSEIRAPWRFGVIAMTEGRGLIRRNHMSTSGSFVSSIAINEVE
jgi:hypothetical protein